MSTQEIKQTPEQENQPREKGYEIKELIKRGKAKGTLSQSEIMEALEDVDYDIEQIEKLYETLLTNEECANAMDLGNFYRVPCDKRDLNYDKYFTQGDIQRNTLTEFNSNNTDLWTVEQVKEKLLSLQYIQDELIAWEK